MSRTLTQLILAVRQEANMENTNFVTDTEVTRRIVEAQYELYDRMLVVDRHLFVTSQTFTLSGSTTTFDLTTLTPLYYQMVGLDLSVGGPKPLTIHRFNWSDRNRYGSTPAYSPEGNSLVFRSNTGIVAGTYTIWYTPKLTELASGSDTLDVFTDNYQEFITVSAAIRCMTKSEESDPAALAARKGELIDRILAAVANRNAEPEQIPDVTSNDAADWWGGW